VTLDGFGKLLAVKGIPRCRYDGGLFIVLAQKGHAGGQLVFGQAVGVAEHDGIGVLNLIAEKFTEILHIQAAFACVDDGCTGGNNDLVGQNTLHGTDDVG
jgi:hypothetical protein